MGGGGGFGVKSSVCFFAHFKMKILISKIFVGKTPLGLPFKEIFKYILISSVVLPIHPAKVCIYEICTMWSLNYIFEYIIAKYKYLVKRP